MEPTEAPEPREWLTTGEVARRYDVTPYTVRALILDGTLPAYRRPDGGRFRIDADDAALVMTPRRHPSTGRRLVVRREAPTLRDLTAARIPPELELDAEAGA